MLFVVVVAVSREEVKTFPFPPLLPPRGVLEVCAHHRGLTLSPALPSLTSTATRKPLKR